MSMVFKRFREYLEEKTLDENRAAMEFDTKLRAFRNRFPNGEGEEIIRAAGYKDVRDFLHDPDERKWSRLRIPGQGNYVR